jgi:hypothetical protein
MNFRTKSAALLGIALATVCIPGAARAQTGGPTTPPDPAKADGKAPAEQKVSLDLKDAPIRDALEKLFRQTKSDYSLDNSVQGYVTLKITDQPFETALRLLITRSATPLTYTKESGVYIIKPRRTSQSASGAAPGQGVSGETRSPGGGASGERTLVADQDGNRLITLTGDTFGGGRQMDVIYLTYLDPADIAQLFKIIQIPSFSRQSGTGNSGANGTGVGSGSPGTGSGVPGAGSGNSGLKQ